MASARGHRAVHWVGAQIACFAGYSVKLFGQDVHGCSYPEQTCGNTGFTKAGYISVIVCHPMLTRRARAEAVYVQRAKTLHAIVVSSKEHTEGGANAFVALIFALPARFVGVARK